MSDQGFLVLYRFRFLLCGLLVIASLLVLSLLLSFVSSSQAQASSANTDSSSSYSDNPNIITDGFNSALEDASHATDATLAAVQGVNNSFKHAAGATVSTTASGGKFLARGAFGMAAFAVHGVGKAAGFAAHTPIYAWHGLSSAAHIGSFIKPAAADKTPVPQIDSTIADEIANSKLTAATTPAVVEKNDSPQWPIHGEITEEFGVPHWPWQPIHTGIDISDGAPQGTTPIHPFKPGRVIVVIHSGYGFGNHVIVDHGNGLLSLYGHMYATAVQQGQLVNKDTVLGYEGTTGASTGVHVHFEIELNGQPVSPHLYVPGKP